MKIPPFWWLYQWYPPLFRGPFSATLWDANPWRIAIIAVRCMVRLKPNRKAGRQLGWLVNRSIESYNVQSSKVEFAFAYLYWGMVIDPFTGIYTPSVRIPILGWTTIHPYTMLWPWHMCFWHPRKRWKSVSPKCISTKYLKARIKQSWAKVYSSFTVSSVPSFIPTPKKVIPSMSPNVTMNKFPTSSKSHCHCHNWSSSFVKGNVRTLKWRYCTRIGHILVGIFPYST